MDHYKVLQVTRDAEPEVIEKAYKALSLKYHPDVVSPARRADAGERMRAINEAHAVLGDPVRRRRYDEALPFESPSAWERFLEVGLVGMFADHWRNREGL